jgi:hypothetical protein
MKIHTGIGRQLCALLTVCLALSLAQTTIPQDSGDLRTRLTNLTETTAA